MTPRFLLVSALFITLLGTSCSPAKAAPAPDDQAAVIAALVARIDVLEKQVADLSAANKRREGVPAATAPRRATSSPRTAPQTPSAPVAATAAPATTTAAAPSPPPPLEETKAQDESGDAVQSALVRRNAVLLSPGQYEIEPSFNYAPTSSDFVSIDGFSIFPVLIVGSVTTEQVRKDNLIGTLTGRAGLPYGFQADVRIPYQYGLEERTRADGHFTRNEEYGLGDIALGLSKELWISKGGYMPNLIGRVQWKTTTGRSVYDGASLGIGSGFNALRTEITALRPIDPAAVYATLGYTVNFGDDKGASGDINPGDTISAALGTTLALNRDLAISFGFDAQWTQNSSLNGVTVNGSSYNVGDFTFGMTYQFMPNRRLDMGFSAGLTRDAPDYSVTLSMPFRF